MRSPPPSLVPFAVLCACAWPVAAAAQVFKCEGAGGSPVYQDAPCPPGRELRNFTTDPPPVSVVPLRPPSGATARQAAPPPPPKARRAAPAGKGTPVSGDPAQRRHLQPGMHEGEVLARIGPPDMKSGGSGRKLARWTYMPVPGDPQTLTTVVFDTGKVIEVERKIVP